MSALLAALLLAAPTPQVTLSADGLVSSDPTGGPASSGSNLSGRLLEIVPLGWAEAALGYSPRLTWAGPAAGRKANLAFFNDGTLRVEVPLGRTRIRLTEGASLGEQDFSILAQSQRVDPQAPPPPLADRLPAERFLPTFSSATGLELTHQASRSLRGVATANFSIGGGLGHDGRSALPLYRSVGGGLLGGWRATTSGELSTTAGATFSLLSNGARSTTVNLQAGWAERLSKDTTATAAAGLALLDNLQLGAGGSAPLATVGRQVAPTASLSFISSVALPVGRLALGSSASASPALDPLGGGSYLRGAARLSCRWAISPSLAIAAAASGDRVLSGLLAGAWGGAAELSTSYRLRRGLTVSASLRAALLTPTRFLLADEDPMHQFAAVAGVVAEL